ncbi:MAG TPA: hypothetical protein VH762_04105 [Gemmatimonadaceae bacterium]|jgi:hypothetical protein
MPQNNIEGRSIPKGVSTVTRVFVAIVCTLLAAVWTVTAAHAQEPSATPEPTGTATAAASPSAEASPTSGAASPTPFNTPEPGELIAPAPQPSVIAPQTGFGDAGGGGDTWLWVGLAIIGVVGLIAGSAGVAARFASVRARNR